MSSSVGFSVSTSKIIAPWSVKKEIVSPKKLLLQTFGGKSGGDIIDDNLRNSNYVINQPVINLKLNT